MKTLVTTLIILVTVSTTSYAGGCPKKAIWNGIEYEVETCIKVQ